MGENAIMASVTNKLSTFPAFYKVAARKIVVVGNGAEAFAKLRLIGETQACVMAIADAPDEALAAYLHEYANDTSSLIWFKAAFTPELLDGATLVFAANGEQEADAIVAQAARACRIPVNVVDRPELCDFFTPALVNRAPIAVAIGSEGSGPVLTQLIRAEIEALLSPDLGTLARLAARLRGRVEAFVARGLMRRLFWRNFFTGSPLRALEKKNLFAAERAALQLLAESGQKPKGQIFLLNGENCPADCITLRAQRTLLFADHIVYDASIDGDLLKIGRRDAERHKCRNTAEETVAFLARSQNEGGHIVRLYDHKGTMVEEMAMLEKAGVVFDILPSLNDGNGVTGAAVFASSLAARHLEARNAA